MARNKREIKKKKKTEARKQLNTDLIHINEYIGISPLYQLAAHKHTTNKNTQLQSSLDSVSSLKL
jgi:hypothetical protein